MSNAIKNDLPQRKHPRLERYDYSSAGAYFITICTQSKRCILSQIVGRGFTPAEISDETDTQITAVQYTRFGEIAKRQLLALEERYPHLAIDRYVIMPNHIHVIFVLDNHAAGVNPRPTVMDIVCAYKSLTTRECKKNGFVGKLFQTSFHEHVIRGHKDYEEITKYIYENPMRWYYDELFVDM